MILLIDNYDSFVHNLARYLSRMGQETRVVRNDAIDTREIAKLSPHAIVLSPGPCTPQEAGNSLQIVREFHSEIPILGVCLGHQVIAAAFGAEIIRSAEPMHGRTSLIKHNGSELFRDIPEQFQICRYHSLVVEPHSLPGTLQVTATTKDGTIMAIQHRDYPVYGVQFHPEAILTEHGYQLLKNFLTMAELPIEGEIEQLQEAEQIRAVVKPANLPTQPVTF